MIVAVQNSDFSVIAMLPLHAIWVDLRIIGFPCLTALIFCLIYLTTTATEAEETSSPPKISLTLKCLQPQLAVKRKPTCVHVDPTSGSRDSIAIESSFKPDGTCGIQLEAGIYEFEVQSMDAKANRLVAIRSGPVTISASSPSYTLPEAGKVTVTASLDGTPLRLDQLAIRSIAPTGEIRWKAGGSSKVPPALLVGGAQPLQICIVGETSRATAAVWGRIDPSSSVSLPLKSLTENECRFEVAPGSPPIRAGKGWMIFPDCRVDFSITPDHRFVTNARQARFGYELDSTAGKKLSVTDRETPLTKETLIALGGSLQASAWVTTIWKDNGKHYLQWQADLQDVAGREVDRGRSDLDFKSSITLMDGSPVPPNPLSKEWVGVIASSPSSLACRASWTWAGPDQFEGTPEGFAPQKSQHFTLQAPSALAAKAAVYLDELERTFASLQKVTKRHGPKTVQVRWRMNTHNAKAQIGGKNPWMSLPFDGLTQALNPLTNPWFMTHEMTHTFGYNHGKTMNQVIAAADRENKRKAWALVDATAQ